MLFKALGKIAQTFVVLFVVSVASFGLLKLAPGDPIQIMLGSEFSQASYDSLRAELGLDQPFLVQYANWAIQFVQGNWGTSYVARAEIFTYAFKEALPVTLTLASFSLLFAILVGVPLGVLSAIKKDTIFDAGSAVLALTGTAFPSFLLGILLIWFFAVKLQLFPVMGYVSPWENFWLGIYHMILPGLTLSTYFIAMITRLTRATLIEVLEQPYIAAARARGEPNWRVVWVHGVRNIAMPLVTILGLQLGVLLQGTVLTETVFNLPGVGQMLTSAVLGREYLVVQAGVMMTAVLFIGVNLLVDLSYPFLDPRLRTSK
ncbi:ABC transporter permease [Pseudosulfitobacter pseudonitzschiae]|uniref:ABC transporter permease n=1 Tax=Pseudosulfitobacter pseudonitzschiae TaxID=1402135 RepID=UPI001AF8A19E|nr:ABC transporter permease [Pseudosulfitobacter pseudonitzschiae]MBM1816750.1 ABC transporter permease [Pseudosulfitobacter pseudonitzschiae]MBM1833560.1 ABC transporter permease [Pseudosulfitobacter pseudonitzschiae]MBM1838427.1 ABC transporter permease [Pseudosulfitobacter pseudonitzschiae]MBM1843477.1 ABC transporter permease [Pseudosulfitobacter pseudonitzschiae]MBM1848343.1 ABC transporter permease [Pseudosulfitobacter pseudonitzschiae]